MKRRDAVKNLSLVPIAGSLMCRPESLALKANDEKPTSKIDYFEELGITRVINANVTMTFLSGSLMLPEVLDAINSTAHDFANMHELQDKVGAKIAEMLKCEAAMVTSGAACAMVLATAACITGDDLEKTNHQLPPREFARGSHRSGAGDPRDPRARRTNTSGSCTPNWGHPCGTVSPFP